jgi:hypothetical protein
LAAGVRTWTGHNLALNAPFFAMREGVNDHFNSTNQDVVNTVSIWGSFKWKRCRIRLIVSVTAEKEQLRCRRALRAPNKFSLAKERHGMFLRDFYGLQILSKSSALRSFSLVALVVPIPDSQRSTRRSSYIHALSPLSLARQVTLLQ